MPKKQNPFIFIIILTIVSSFLLSFASSQLADRRIYNEEVDKKKNILKSIGLDINSMTSVEILDKYKNGIEEIIIDINGSKIDSIKFNDLEIDINKANGNTNYLYNKNKYLPIFKSSKPEAYIIPITGKGLWSTLYGYFAIDNDLNTVKGITFYKHGETPGLGAEIEKEWFQKNFIGKKSKIIQMSWFPLKFLKVNLTVIFIALMVLVELQLPVGELQICL